MSTNKKLETRDRITHWLEPPVFDGDEEKTRRAILINAITLTCILFMAILIPLILFMGNIPALTKLIDIFILVSSLIFRYWLFKGKVKEVSFWIIVVGFTAITAAVISLGTVLTPTTSTYIFMVIFSGLLFDLRGIILSSITSSIIVGGLILLEHAGVFPQRANSIDFAHWVVYVLIFVLSGVLTNYSITITMKVLARARKEIAERKQAEVKLRESEARFRNLFEQTHDAVFLVDRGGRCIAANQRAADMLGYSVDELLTLPIVEIAAQPDDAQKFLTRLLSGETIPHLEGAFRSKDGAVFPVELYLELTKDQQDAPQQIQVVARDIRERKRAEEALIAVNDLLNKRIEEVEQLHKELREQAIRDPLTGLYNRRYLSEMLSRELARVAREKTSLSIIIADIDHFKITNDTYGHQAGDDLLVQIARLVKNATRDSDILCRYGGEEFIIILPGIAIDNAAKRAEDIRRLVENTAFLYQGKTLRMSISLGVAAYPNHGTQAEEITIKADRALYYSKQTGRNRVTVWSEELSRIPHSVS